MKLLCAVMIGIKCVSWHPAGTVIDMMEYDEGERIQGGGIIGDVMWKNQTPFPSGCRNQDRLYDLLGKSPVGTIGYYSCTKKQQDEYKEEQRRKNLNPMQRQHEEE